MMTTNTATHALSIDEFVKRYGLSRGTWYNMKDAGSAPRHFKIGRRTLIPLHAVREWEEAQMGGCAA